MQYRQDKPSGNNLSMLGLGCMRFPRDKTETERMILAAIDGGVNFFDTAYIYPGSEKTLGEVLAKHNRRKDVYIATKLPIVMCKTSADFDRFFNEQLRRLQTDYIDYYFMHNVPDFAQWDAMRKMGIEQWIADKKAAGQIGRIGFSYHGTFDDFLKVLDSYPWEFCMIQYNYYDENYQAGKRGLLAAAEKGLSVIVMEPLLGGRLATGLPKQAVEVFKNTNPDLTPADRALWWLWNHPEVTVVLSGMSSTQIMEQNLRSARNFRSLTDTELASYADVVKIFRKSYKINCTGCNYCLPCPKGINIPACLSAYNTSYAHGYMKGMMLYATTTAVITKTPNSPRLCNDCGKCEKVCPQYIPIHKSLKKVARRFESLPLRGAFALVRRIIGR
ncbi:MAG: aldo/keto reductase [Defluviitaleaceae bacterium]|nr:aldo/keto reductase [Defluviitaleaceae bacterium]